MKKKIVIGHIVSPKAGEFVSSLDDMINSFEKEGYRTEIQYSSVAGKFESMLYSALVIGRLND